MYRIKFLLSLFILAYHCFAGNQPRGYAIVIDEKSLHECEAEVKQYASAVEQYNGLKSIIVVNQWGVPDSIRACLISMYADEKCPLAGAVFVGDIPVPMVRDAQHLTSAFRMNQDIYTWRDTSVPSDRFYDDFGLQFDFICRDTIAEESDSYAGSNTGPCPYFYYSLRADGAQQVRPSIFSGRIRPTDANGTSRYEKLRRYLRKAVRAKQEQNYADQIFYFTGHGSLTESKVAAIDEKANIYEHFPWMLTSREGINYMDFSQEKFIKQRMMNELMREDLDLAFLHHHGDFDTQYLSGYPRNASEEEKHQANLILEDFASYGFAPNCRCVVFDACYNASFHRHDCIANEYVFGEGKNIACIGGTVNVLQDKWYDKLMGLLGEGVYVGIVNAYLQYLESHVVGDPTFTFNSKEASKVSASLNDLIVRAWRGEVKAKEVRKNLLQSSLPDLQVLGMEILAEMNAIDNAELLKMLDESPYSEVRLQALQMLAQRGGDDFVEGIALASRDRNEMVQRFAMNHIRGNGCPRLAASLIRIVLANNPSARVKFDASEALAFVPKENLMQELERQQQQLVSTDKDSTVNALRKKIEQSGDFWQERIDKLIADSLDEKQFKFIGSSLRLYLPHNRIHDVISYIERPSTPIDRKQKLTEALGWNTASYYRNDIADFAKRLSENPDEDYNVRKEALKTYNRLKTKQ